MIKLVETLPNKVFPTPTGILVASHGPNVEDYDKRLVIPANAFHAIQIGTNANTNPGVSYPLNELSKKDWSDQVSLILTQFSIPKVSAQDIKTVHQYVKGFTMIYEDGFNSEVSKDFLSIHPCQRRDLKELHELHRSRTGHFQRERAKARTNPKMTLRLLSQRVWHSLLRFISLGIRISLQRFRYIHPNSIGKIWSASISCLPVSEVTARFAALTTLTPSNISTTEPSDTLPRKVNPTHAGVLDVPSILRTHSNCRGRNGGLPEHFNPFFQYSNSELVRLNTHDVYTPSRFERWVVVGLMVTMRYSNVPFNSDGDLCHYYKQPTTWLNSYHFANKGCKEGNNCRFAHCNQELEVAERLLRALGHEFPHEARALIKV